MKTRFRISEKTTITAKLFNSEGKLIASLYDSGFTNLPSVYRALLIKHGHPPKGTAYSVTNEDNGNYWSNRKK